MTHLSVIIFEGLLISLLGSSFELVILGLVSQWQPILYHYRTKLSQDSELELEETDWLETTSTGQNYLHLLWIMVRLDRCLSAELLKFNRRSALAKVTADRGSKRHFQMHLHPWINFTRSPMCVTRLR